MTGSDSYLKIMFHWDLGNIWFSILPVNFATLQKWEKEACASNEHCADFDNDCMHLSKNNGCCSEAL